MARDNRKRDSLLLAGVAVIFAALSGIAHAGSVALPARDSELPASGPNDISFGSFAIESVIKHGNDASRRDPGFTASLRSLFHNAPVGAGMAPRPLSPFGWPNINRMVKPFGGNGLPPINPPALVWDDDDDNPNQPGDDCPSQRKGSGKGDGDGGAWDIDPTVVPLPPALLMGPVGVLLVALARRRVK